MSEAGLVQVWRTTGPFRMEVLPTWVKESSLPARAGYRVRCSDSPDYAPVLPGTGTWGRDVHATEEAAVAAALAQLEAEVRVSRLRLAQSEASLEEFRARYRVQSALSETGP